MSVAGNVVLKSYRGAPVSRGPLLAVRRMREVARALVQRYDVKTPSTETPVATSQAATFRSSSWGASSRAPRALLIAAQPTRGLDVGEDDPRTCARRPLPVSRFC